MSTMSSPPHPSSARARRRYTPQSISAALATSSTAAADSVSASIPPLPPLTPAHTRSYRHARSPSLARHHVHTPTNASRSGSGPLTSRRRHRHSARSPAGVTFIAQTALESLGQRQAQAQQQPAHADPFPLHVGNPKLRLPTPIPPLYSSARQYGGSQSARVYGSSSMNAGPSNDDGINLALPDETQSIPTLSSPIGSPPPSSTLASLTKDTNQRLSQFLDQYGGQRHQSDSSTDRSVHMLLTHMLHRNPEKLELEKAISRLLCSWQSGAASQSFNALSNKIKSIIAERLPELAGGSGADRDRDRDWDRDFGNGSGGEMGSILLNEDMGWVRQEIESRRHVIFRFPIPVDAHARGCRVDFQVQQGRVEMYARIGEVLTPAGFAREKAQAQTHAPMNGVAASAGTSTSTKLTSPSDAYGRQPPYWALRAGVGHHVLNVGDRIQADQRVLSRRDDTLYITFYALQHATIQVKVDIGIRSRMESPSGTPRDGGSSSFFSIASAPASSTTRPTARQHSSTCVAPSHRTIRQMIDARIQRLKNDPKEMKKLLQHVRKIRMMGRKGMGLMMTDDETEENEQEETKSNPKYGGVRFEERKSNHADHSLSQARTSQQSTQSIRKKEKRTDSYAPSRPHPLTPHTLAFIPHIGAISGLSELFFETVHDLRRMNALGGDAATLDEDNYLLTSDSMEETEGDPGPDSVFLTQTAENRSNDNVEITSRGAAAPSKPSIEVASVALREMVDRVCARLKHKAEMMEASLVSNRTDASPTRSTRSQSHSPGRRARNDSTHTDHLDSESLAYHARFYARAARILSSHMSPIVSLLLILAGYPPDIIRHRSASFAVLPLSMQLASSSSSCGSPPPKNFLLANAFDATENESFKPSIREWRRRERAEQHKRKLEAAAATHEKLLTSRREATLADIERRERERQEAFASKVASATKHRLEHVQRHWLTALALAARLQWLRAKGHNLGAMRIEAFTRRHAAKTIQLFVRASLMLRRQTKATLHFQAARSLLLLCAHTYGAIKKDRAANILKSWLEKQRGVNSVARVIKNFRKRVDVCQRAVRNWLATKTNKINVWRRQYQKALTAMGGAHARKLLADKATRDRLLAELWTRLKKQAQAAWPSYYEKVAAYEEHESSERAKALLNGQLNRPTTMVPPKRPKIPVMLNMDTLNDVIDQALDMERNRLVQLMTETAENAAIDLVAECSTTETIPHHPTHRTRASNASLALKPFFKRSLTVRTRSSMMMGNDVTTVKSP